MFLSFNIDYKNLFLTNYLFAGFLVTLSTENGVPSARCSVEAMPTDNFEGFPINFMHLNGIQ